MNSNEKPVVTIIYDIALGGVSFFFAKEIVDFYDDFTMDILIYDSLTNFEYSITEIKGQLSSGIQMRDATGIGLIWRYGVEFLDMNSEQIVLLETLLHPVGKVRSI